MAAHISGGRHLLHPKNVRLASPDGFPQVGLLPSLLAHRVPAIQVVRHHSDARAGGRGHGKQKNEDDLHRTAPVLTRVCSKRAI